ncbi:MAG: MarR family transcriptional regulator [Thermoproteota archaeon]|jgi:DNA-binding MarR family transcriptional regulator|nr:MarR family transcriptional regulator [Thermoproteota archaeon]
MNREETIQTIVDRFMEMSTETIMFHQAVADELGLHITDHKCMDIIHRFGAMPAGRLGEMTGLTTGAITGMIDRLEKAGYVRRANDPKDRRKTIVEPIINKKLEKKIEIIFTPLHKRMNKFLSSYSDSELSFLLDAMTKLIEQTREESKRLRSLRKKPSFST